MTRTDASTREQYPGYLLHKPTTIDTTRFWYLSQERWDTTSDKTKYKITRIAIMMKLPEMGVPASKPCQACVSATTQEVCIFPRNPLASKCTRCVLTRDSCDGERVVIIDTRKCSTEKAGVRGGPPMDHCDDSTDDEKSRRR